MPSISCIVARSNPGHIIGSGNKLPWNLKTDLKKFRETTTDHAVIMGRKTFESIGRPLPNRTNIILSREAGNNGNDVYWVNNVENALYIADIMTIVRGKASFFVIGGSQIYSAFHHLINKIYLTEVLSDGIIGDSYFNINFDMRRWKIISSNKYDKNLDDEYDFTIDVLERKIKTVRQHTLSYFMTENKRDLFPDETERKAANRIIDLQPAIQLELNGI